MNHMNLWYHILKTRLFFWLIIFISGSLPGQIVDDHPSSTAHEKEEIVRLSRDLFEKGPSVQYSISTTDVKSSFSDIPDPIDVTIVGDGVGTNNGWVIPIILLEKF